MPKIDVPTDERENWGHRLSLAIEHNPDFKHAILMEALYLSVCEQQWEETWDANPLRNDFFGKVFSVRGRMTEQFKAYVSLELQRIIGDLIRVEMVCLHTSMIRTVNFLRDDAGLMSDPDMAPYHYSLSLVQLFLVQNKHVDNSVIYNAIKKQFSKNSFLKKNVDDLVLLSFLAILSQFIPKPVLHCLIALFIILKVKNISSYRKDADGLIMIALTSRLEDLGDHFQVKYDFVPRTQREPQPGRNLKPYQPTDAERVAKVRFATDSPLQSRKTGSKRETKSSEPAGNKKIIFEFVDITSIKPPLTSWKNAKCFRVNGNKYYFAILNRTAIQEDRVGKIIYESITTAFAKGFKKTHVSGIVFDSDDKTYKIIPSEHVRYRVTPSEIRTCNIGDESYELYTFEHIIDTHKAAPKPPRRINETPAAVQTPILHVA